MSQSPTLALRFFGVKPQTRSEALANAGDLSSVEIDGQTQGLDRVDVRADLHFPAFWLDRLRQALAKHRGHIVPLCNAAAATHPLALGRSTDWSAKTLDQLCYLLGGDILPIEATDIGVRGVAHDAANTSTFVFTGLYLESPAHPRAGFPVPTDRRELPPPTPFAELSARLAHLPDVPDAAQLPAPDPARQSVLHISHDWGGGVARFTRDLATADSAHTHLLLNSHGHHSRERYGEWLELRLANQPNVLIARWPRHPPIVDLGRSTDGEERRMLRALCARYQVGRIVVSSVIGHDLSVLSSGLATAVVTHDYWPLWPQLHRNFDEFEMPRTAEHWEQLLPTDAVTRPFARRSAAQWAALRADFLAQLIAARPTMVAPSDAVLRNWQRLAPETAALDWMRIDHGCATTPQATPAPAPGKKLRVLVPGRIDGGKGADLLTQLIALARPCCEFWLLGSGSAGMTLFGQAGVHIVLDYAHDDLPALVHQIAPDLALLPRSVAETFSYALSEMQALGIPVLGTALGSLCERIDDGVTGFLAPPSAADLARRLANLAQDRRPLHRVRAYWQQHQPRSVAQMTADYAAAGLLDGQTLAPQSFRPPVLSSHAQCEALARSDVAALRATVSDQHHELQRRAQWAMEQARIADDMRNWALAQGQEVERLVRLIREAEKEKNAAQLRLRGEYEQLISTTVQQLSAEHREAFEAEAGRMNAAHQALEAELTRMDAAQRTLQNEHIESIRDRDQARNRIRELETSTIWRLSAPLRQLIIAAKLQRTAVRYRLSRIRALWPRMLSSLQRRGLTGTVKRASAGLRPPPDRSTLQVPESVPNQPALRLPRSATPRVTIIIPVYNKFSYTERCLRTVATHTTTIPIEVIVVDDGSTDETAAALVGVEGLIYHRNPENLGFIGACNAGAARASGEFLCFLNNDTAVQPGWMTALLDTFEAQPDAGLVGAKLVYPDGRLQESGGIIFADGSGWNYGRFEDPEAPSYNFVREVDYVSGAAIVLRRSDFEQLGGFDTRYTPAYYEDTDLAFQIRGMGKRVYLQPESVVVHYEGISSGTDLNSGAKRYQVINQSKFLTRWADVLAMHPAPGTPIDIAREHRLRGRILVIDACTPTPDQDSGSVRMVNLLRVLISLGYRPTFFAENRAYAGAYTKALQRIGVEVLYHPHLASVPQFFRDRGSQFDVVLVSRHYVASQFIELVRRHAPQARLVFDTVDLHYLREQRAAELAGDAGMRQRAAQTKREELAIMQACDLTVVVSPAEKALLQSDAPGVQVLVVSNIFEVVGRRREFEARADLLFVGGFEHTPNVDAMVWFCAEVLPLVRARLPALTLHIVGSKATDAVHALAGPGVKVHGFVPDIEPLLDGCRINLAPLRYGAGVKGKINSALSYGLPTVATTVAAEGMGLRDRHDVCLADSAADFAAAVVGLYQDPALWQQISDNGLNTVRDHYSVAAATQQVRHLLGKY